jgi:hypothetical protein
MNTLAQRIALYFTLGLVLHTLEVTIYVWQFWAVLALFWTSEYMVRKSAEEQAMAEGVSRFLDMSSDQQNRIKKLHDQLQREENDR